MPGNCTFQESWLDSTLHAEWSLWLRKVETDKRKALCLLCRTMFDVSSMGLSSVKSHEKGKKHELNIKNVKHSRSLDTYCSTELPNATTAVLPTSSCILDSHVPTCSTSVDKFLVKDEVTRAEVIWALHSTVYHSSGRSTGHAADVFKIMFCDSQVAQKFQMHKDKFGYIVTYGLGPHFQAQLASTVSQCEFYALSFDESLNTVVQKGQMDIIVRFMDDKAQETQTRYLTSAFVGHATSKDLQEALESSLLKHGLEKKKILHVSMDGPNVNIKLLNDLKADLAKDNADGSPQLFDTGTCSLHIVHGSYKTAHNKVNWSINIFLRALYYLFKDFPSRRAEYIRITHSVLFPMKFCSIRWLDNSAVIDRAIAMLPFLRVYVNGVGKKPPASANFERVKSALSDPTLHAKLGFLQSVAVQLEPFLKAYQTDEPMLPFMYTDLFNLLRSIMDRFIKELVMSGIKDVKSLLKVDVTKRENKKEIRKVDVGFAAKQACAGLKELDVITFRKDCCVYLEHVYLKLTQKCPLSRKIVKGASCLSPTTMQSEVLRSSRITTALEEFIEKKQLSPGEADSIKRDYIRLCDTPTVQKTLKQFSRKNDRLDVFLLHLLEDDNVCLSQKALMKKFMQKIFVMFHGNAAVERSFSINKDCLVENLLEDALIAQRSVYDAVHHAGGVTNIEITKGLIHSVRNASSLRVQALKVKKTAEKEEISRRKRLAEELKGLEEKKKRIMGVAKEEAGVLEEQIMKVRETLNAETK